MINIYKKLTDFGPKNKAKTLCPKPAIVKLKTVRNIDQNHSQKTEQSPVGVRGVSFNNHCCSQTDTQ